MVKMVKKRTGFLEPFSTDKIAAVLKAAGLEDNKTNHLVEELNKWAESLPEEEISSLRIRDQVLDCLNTLDPYIAGLYRWYEQSKEVK